MHMMVTLSHLRRSEEHTSELQSRPHLVCRLLLEKKKRASTRSNTTAVASASLPSRYAFIMPPPPTRTTTLSLHDALPISLLNGTQFMSAHGVYAIMKAQRLSVRADLIAAMSLDAYDGHIEPFEEKLHLIRPHIGQLETSQNICSFLEGSEIITREKQHLQDPYSFRCIPQVHGATKDAIDYAKSVVHTEINSVTDNPTIFPDDDKIISGGNFHGQPLAIAYDFLAIAMAELGNISERRIAQLILGKRGLPEFLVANPGLNSGFMIPQYVAASVVSQNRIYCSPASIDSIVSSNGQEDHVSMGATSAMKLLKVMDNLDIILAIELMNAAQALEFRRPLKSSPIIEKVLKGYRKEVPFIDEDIVMYKEIRKTSSYLNRLQVSAL